MADTIQKPIVPPEATKHNPQEEKIHVMVRNRRQILFDDEVKAITSRNDTGLFDVLPEHSNFISTIKEKIVIHKLDGQTYEVLLSNGIIKVKNSSIRCYIDLINPEANKQ